MNPDGKSMRPFPDNYKTNNNRTTNSFKTNKSRKVWPTQPSQAVTNNEQAKLTD